MIIALWCVIISYQSYGEEGAVNATVHEKTKHTREKVAGGRRAVDPASKPDVFKYYSGEKVLLAKEFDRTMPSLRNVLMGDVAVHDARLTLNDLSYILYHTNGITRQAGGLGMKYYFRAAPSAGALYPTEIYVAIRDVEGTQKGLYYYSVKDDALYLVRAGDVAKEIIDSSGTEVSPELISALVIFTGIAHRTMWKYGERGARYVSLDTGHAAANNVLIGNALGLTVRVNTHFNAASVAHALDVNINEEQPYVITALLKNKQSIETKGNVTLRSDTGRGNGIALPPVRPEGKTELDNVIRDRRSQRVFSGERISLHTAADILFNTAGFLGRASYTRSIWDDGTTMPLRLYVIIHNVETLKNGLYEYDPKAHALHSITTADLEGPLSEACMGQRFVGKANIAVIKTISTAYLDKGEHAYTDAHIIAGALGENAYLAAESYGLGACGIGAFFDDEVNQLLGIDPAQETVVYITAIGAV